MITEKSHAEMLEWKKIGAMRIRRIEGVIDHIRLFLFTKKPSGLGLLSRSIELSAGSNAPSFKCKFWNAVAPILRCAFFARLGIDINFRTIAKRRNIINAKNIVGSIGFYHRYATRNKRLNSFEIQALSFPETRR